MAGNPFPRVVKWSEVRSGDGEVSGRVPLDDGGSLVDPKAYVYDSTQNGQPYRAVTANGTPGVSDEIKPYQGFWIRRNGVTGGATQTLGLPFEK